MPLIVGKVECRRALIGLPGAGLREQLLRDRNWWSRERGVLAVRAAGALALRPGALSTSVPRRP